MSIKRQREEFVGYMTRALPDKHYLDVLEFCRRVLRLSQTHGRLAVADCNGDWPAQGEWCSGRMEKACRQCGRCGCWHAKSTVSAKSQLCKSCRTEDRISELAVNMGLKADFQGDPRGWTCKLIVDGREIGIPQHE